MTGLLSIKKYFLEIIIFTKLIISKTFSILRKLIFDFQHLRFMNVTWSFGLHWVIKLTLASIFIP
jgi:hypothetical protein